MKIVKNLTFLAVAALAVTLLSHIPISRAVAQNNDNKHKLDLRVYFEKFAYPFVYPAVPNFGDQFTIGGTVARFETPNQRIGTFVIQFVATAPGAAETLLSGVLNLPEGQISFTGLSPTQEPRIPGPITGGTGIYWNARGQVDHRSPAAGIEELILTFNGN